MIALTALLLIQLIGQSPATGQASWAISHVDRASLIALDTNTIKLGMSGAQSAMITILADPAPNEHAVSIIKIESDCFSKRVSMNGSITMDPGGLPVENKSASEWEVPTQGSMLEAMMRYACNLSPEPKEWIDTHITSSGPLIDFYYTKVLGHENPFTPR